MWYWDPIWANNLVTTIERKEFENENQMKNVLEFLILVSFSFTWCFESFGGLRPNIITPKRIGLDQTLVPKVLYVCVFGFAIVKLEIKNEKQCCVNYRSFSCHESYDSALKTSSLFTSDCTQAPRICEVENGTPWIK